MHWQLPKPLYDKYEWQDRALCRRVDSQRFFNEDTITRREQHRREVAAKRVCGRCPVRDACLAHALQSEPHGIWGGLTAAERVALRENQLVEARTA